MISIDIFKSLIDQGFFIIFILGQDRSQLIFNECRFTKATVQPFSASRMFQGQEIRKGDGKPMIPRRPRVLAIHKPIGVTSHRMAMKLSQKLRTKVSHTGNLDPMAEGVLVFLIGPEALEQQSRLQNADKEYEFDVLLGFSTDSYDQLGLVDVINHYKITNDLNNKLKHCIHKLPGKHRMPRPAYSYKKIGGKPLYWWARQGRLHEIPLPEVEVLIYKAELIRVWTVTKRRLRTTIMKNVRRVGGDFRQEAILKRWDQALKEHPNERFCVARIRMTCSKGTYVRSIAHHIGISIGILSMALRILRTKTGKITLSDCIKLSESSDCYFSS
jgi:tRNA pseudouridine55 synthase